MKAKNVGSPGYCGFDESEYRVFPNRPQLQRQQQHCSTNNIKVSHMQESGGRMVGQTKCSKQQPTACSRRGNHLTLMP